MNRLECMVATLLHEEPPVVPQDEGFMSTQAQRKLVPSFPGKDQRERAVRYADFMDNFSMGCGGGGFRSKRIEESPEYVIEECESGRRVKTYKLAPAHHATWHPPTGAEARTLHNWTQVIRYPIEHKEDLAELELPNPDDPTRYDGIEENVKYFTELKYFTTCGINGFFSGVWYLFMPFKAWLKALTVDKPFAKKLVAKIGEFNLKAAKNLLETGVHCITWSDDLGYNERTFISPKTYEEVIYPWHEKVVRLAHRFGAFTNMHSHGNINALLPYLVRAGLDAVNPVGPGDNMNLAEVKEKFGDRITFDGGITKHLAGLSKEQLREHVAERIRVGSPGGGYILKSEGGIPADMSHENFELYLKCSKKYRRNPFSPV